jgi:hypothetical protein
MQAAVKFTSAQSYPSRSTIRFTLFAVLLWIIVAWSAFRQAEIEEKTPAPVAHTKMWVEPDPVPTPVIPQSGSATYPRPSKMPVGTI